ncbi:hypothetical protein [Methanosarcina acetivorans]|nr:hypothetical protein [Methanosarcina acetivorans]
MTWENWVQKALLYENGELKIVSEVEEKQKYADTIKQLDELRRQQKR